MVQRKAHALTNVLCLLAFCAIYTEVAVAADSVASGAVFQAMPVERTGIDHINPQYWRGRLDSAVRFFNQMVPGCGVALGDIDNDGRTDVILSGFRGLSLYRNLGDWKFENLTKSIGYPQDSLQYCTGPTVADIDADGDLDLVCPGKSGLYLFENLRQQKR